MTSPGSSGRKRVSSRTHGAEEQALDQIAREAEARLAARRAARAEARDIRMKELEKQQKEADEKKDRHFELTADHQNARPTRVYNSRRDSDDSTSTEGGDSARELKKEINELDEKYKKAMMNNAQLDNEKQTYRYQVELLKDQLEEMEEQLIELQRQHKESCRELEAKKRDFKDLKTECSFLKNQIHLRDELIEQYGLVFMSNDDSEGSEKAALVTPQAKEILQKFEGSLDQRIKQYSEENSLLEEEVKRLKLSLEAEKEKNALSEKYPTPVLKEQVVANGPDMQLLEVQMEAQRQISDYKFKLKKTEQDITQLEGNVIRLESQVKRYKTSAETAERNEEELKTEKRKLLRELREAQAQTEELQTSNQHLQKRLEKIKSARNAVMGGK